jgi:hypothetical protein
VFENRVLRRIFGPKRDEVTGDWRKLHNEDLHNLYSSPNIIRLIKLRRMRWTVHVGRLGRTGKPEGKKPIRKPRRAWVDNIKSDLREIVWDGVDWMDMAQDRDQWLVLVNTMMMISVV